jgi:hypothetical protein
MTIDKEKDHIHKSKKHQREPDEVLRNPKNSEPPADKKKPSA